MTADPTTLALRLGVLLLGCVLLWSSIQGLRSGRTTGYYRSHVRTRREHPVRFTLWVTGRAVLGLLCLTLGLLFP